MKNKNDRQLSHVLWKIKGSQEEAVLVREIQGSTSHECPHETMSTLLK